MTDAFNEMLLSWHDFYFMTGGAAAAMLGLMFVALSLGMHLVTAETRSNMETFVTPSIYYFVSALVLASVMLVPAFTTPIFEIVLFVAGLLGLGRAMLFVRRLIAMAILHQDFNIGDWLAQIILPILSYALIVLAAICFALNLWTPGFFGLWTASVLLLICGIANTWSLVMWIVDQRRD